MIIPVGGSNEVRNFSKKYSYLIEPFYGGSIFTKGDKHSRPSTNLIDIYNALAHLRDKPEWKEIRDHGVYCYTWSVDDPLADVFLSQLGGYPDKDEIGTDYLDLLRKAANPTEISLTATDPIPTVTIEHPSISYLSRHALKRHYGIQQGWNTPGFFVGSASNLEDLVCHWNIRACDILLWFVDPQYIQRYADLIPAWEKIMEDEVASYRHEADRKVAVWTRQEDLDEACKPFGESKLMRCHVSDGVWNGQNIRAPMMYFGGTSVLGVMGGEDSKPKVTFALSDKLFCSDICFHQQHLVASVSLIGGLYGNDQFTFHPPYIPELNEFYAHAMHFQYNKLRIEPERIGVVIDVCDQDSFLYALPVADLVEQIFDMAGYEAELSNSGLITKQLITQLDGLYGGRVFKIHGVRRLLKTFGLNDSVKKNTALQVIGNKDPDRSEAKFSDHKDLYIEQRPDGVGLTPGHVFGYMVEKGLFRIGSDMTCPSCKLKSWVPLDSLKHKVVCDLCGHEHDVTRVLTDTNEWHYRRSGILGTEKNAQGAIPVLLTLQFLDEKFHGGLRDSMYSPSLNLIPKKGIEGVNCETDFVWIIPRSYPQKTVIILAECKDQGPIDSDDVSKLKRIADSLPRKRFKTFVALSQIEPFTDDEIKLAKTLNDKNRRRAIMLSYEELESNMMSEERKDTSGRELRWHSPEDMADSSVQLYFRVKGDGGIKN